MAILLPPDVIPRHGLYPIPTLRVPVKVKFPVSLPTNVLSVPYVCNTRSAFICICPMVLDVVGSNRFPLVTVTLPDVAVSVVADVIDPADVDMVPVVTTRFPELTVNGELALLSALLVAIFFYL